MKSIGLSDECDCDREIRFQYERSFMKDFNKGLLRSRILLYFMMLMMSALLLSDSVTRPFSFNASATGTVYYTTDLFDANEFDKSDVCLKATGTECWATNLFYDDESCQVTIVYKLLALNA